MVCKPVKIYAGVTVAIILIACIINIVIDYFNNEGFLYSLGKNGAISFCASIYCLITAFILTYICTCNKGPLVVWLMLALMFLCCVSGILANFTHGYYYIQI